MGKTRIGSENGVGARGGDDIASGGEPLVVCLQPSGRQAARV
jgi:hypothetical protein